jgi:hypothetical protein
VACDCRRMLAGTSSQVTFGALFVGAMDVEDDGMNSPRSLAQLPSACLISVLHLCFTRITESVLQTTSVCRFLQDRTICMLVGGIVGFVVGGLNWCDTPTDITRHTSLGGRCRGRLCTTLCEGILRSPQSHKMSTGAARLIMKTFKSGTSVRCNMHWTGADWTNWRGQCKGHGPLKANAIAAVESWQWA